MPIKFLNSGLLEGSLQLTSYGGGSISGTGTYNLGVDASGNVIETSLIEGSGTTNYVVKWTPDGNTLGNSQIFDNGTNVGVGTNQPDYKLDVDGQIRSTSSSFPVYFLQRETSITGNGTFTSPITGIASGFHLRTNSSGTIQDGFGGGIVFSLTDSGTASNTAARIYARRDGGDTTAALQFWGGSDGTTSLTTMRADGSVYFDEYGSGTFTGTAVKNLSITSSGKIIETDAVPANVVETVTTTDGTYINLTPNSPTDGAVTVTADLSAVDGTSGANERYLTKTNKWAEISTIPGTYTWSVDGDQGTPYTVNSGNTVDFAGSTYITTSTISGPTLVITHDNTARNNTTSSSSPNFGSSFTAIDSITTNSTGHVTAVNTKTINLSNPVWFADADTGSEDITNGTTVTFVGGTGMDSSINSSYEITFTNTDRGSSQNIFKNVAVSGQSTIVADSNNDTLTFVAGSNVSITTNATNDSITINATDTNTNNYVSSISFNTTNGVLTLNRSGLSSLTVDLDGRYLTGNQTITLTGDVTGSGTTSIATNVSADVIGASELKVTGNGTTSQFLRSDGDGTFSWATPTDTNTNNYVTSASFNTGNGVLTLNRSGLSAVTVDLDGRYLTSYTETDTLQSVTNRGASTTVRSSFTGGLNTNNLSTRDKISVYTGDPYVIGMQSGITFGHLNDWGMTFQFNDESDRGFWWGDSSHSTAQGAMSLTTDGRLTVANSISVGQGEGITTPSSHPLYVDGRAVFDTTSNTEPVCISRSGSSSNQVLQIGVTDTQTQFIYIEDTSSEGTGNFGKYQFYLGGNAGESNIMPFEITKDNSIFSVPVKIESTANYPRLTIGDIDNVNNSQAMAILEIGNRISSGYSGGTEITTINGLYSASTINFKHGVATIGGDISSPRGQLGSYYTGTANDYNIQLSHYNATGSQDNYMSMRADYTYFNKEIRIGGTTSANGLDDYEEGTWTISFLVGSMGSLTGYSVSQFSGGTASCSYVKVGRVVHCAFYFGCNSFPWGSSTSSYVLIAPSSLPFTPSGGSSNKPTSGGNGFNGTYYSFPGFSSSATSNDTKSPSLFWSGYASSYGIGFQSNMGYYANFQSAVTDDFNSGPGSPNFDMWGNFSYRTDS